MSHLRVFIGKTCKYAQLTGKSLTSKNGLMGCTYPHPYKHRPGCMKSPSHFTTNLMSSASLFAFSKVAEVFFCNNRLGSLNLKMKVGYCGGVCYWHCKHDHNSSLHWAMVFVTVLVLASDCQLLMCEMQQRQWENDNGGCNLNFLCNGECPP